MRKLNIGCGRNWEQYPGYEGVDWVDFGQQHVLNLEKKGLKGIESGSVDEIRAWSVMEHIHQDRVIFVMNECWRVLKSGGKMHLKVPRFPSDNSVQDPTHFSFWTPKTFTLYFAGKSPRNADYGIKKWGICHSEGKYLMEVDSQSIDIWLYKK